MGSSIRIIRLSIIILLFGIAMVQCSRDDCYYVKVRFEGDTKIQKDNPVFYGNGLIGNVEELSKMGTDSTIVKLCILDTVAIPKKSVFVSGFISAFGVNGIQVIPSQEKEQLSKDKTFEGLSTDTIRVKLPELDSVFVEKFIDIIRELKTRQN